MNLLLCYCLLITNSFGFLQQSVAMKEWRDFAKMDDVKSVTTVVAKIYSCLLTFKRRSRKSSKN